MCTPLFFSAFPIVHDGPFSYLEVTLGSYLTLQTATCLAIVVVFLSRALLERVTLAMYVLCFLCLTVDCGERCSRWLERVCNPLKPPEVLRNLFCLCRHVLSQTGIVINPCSVNDKQAAHKTSECFILENLFLFLKTPDSNLRFRSTASPRRLHTFATRTYVMLDRF